MKPLTFESLGLPSREQLARLRIWDPYTGIGGGSGESFSDGFRRLLEETDLFAIERYFARFDILDEDMAYYDDMQKVLAEFPDRLIGMARVNPSRLDDSMEAIDRWIGEGPLVGVHFGGGGSSSLPCVHPNSVALMKRLTEYNAFILHHTWLRVHAPLGKQDENATTPAEMAQFARENPDIPLVALRTGGDWEIGLRELAPYPQIGLECSGSDPTSGFIEMVIREAGADRIIWASHSFSRGGIELSKALCSGLTEEQLKLVLGGNLRRRLAPIMHAKGMSIEV